MNLSPSKHEEWAWKGDRYADGWNGIRLLVLGESSYGKDLKPTSPRKLIECYLGPNDSRGPEPWRRTYTRFLKILSNKNVSPTTDERKYYWERLAFTNYLTSAAGVKAGDRPTEAQWDESLSDFFKFLEWLNPQPDGVIVWGKSLYRALAQNPGCRWGNPPNQCWQGNQELKMGFIHWPGGRPIPAVYITHPSTPISGSPESTKLVQDFLRRFPDR